MKKYIVPALCSLLLTFSLPAQFSFVENCMIRLEEHKELITCVLSHLASSALDATRKTKKEITQTIKGINAASLSKTQRLTLAALLLAVSGYIFQAME